MGWVANFRQDFFVLLILALVVAAGLVVAGAATMKLTVDGLAQLRRRAEANPPAT